MTTTARCPHCDRPYWVAREGEGHPGDVPYSIHHVRCIQCGWPTALAILQPGGLCRQCAGLRP